MSKNKRKKRLNGNKSLSVLLSSSISFLPPSLSVSLSLSSLSLVTKKRRSLQTMADVLSRSDLIFLCGGRSAPLPCERRSPSSVGFRRSSSSNSAGSSLLSSNFRGRKLVTEERRVKPIKGTLHPLPVQMSLCIGKAMKWWAKGLQSNMKEIQSAQDLVDSLLAAGDRMVVLDFFSPGCGGCKALHPKICQFAEMNPDALFLQVNYEEHKSMCYSLNVHVLPFFRFYRGAQGRVCSFSCTNATIKKFKDAMAKHNTDRCSLGPAKGLEESELMALAANRDLSFSYTPRKPEPAPAVPEEIAEPVPADPKLPAFPMPRIGQYSAEKAPATSGR